MYYTHRFSIPKIYIGNISRHGTIVHKQELLADGFLTVTVETKYDKKTFCQLAKLPH